MEKTLVESTPALPVENERRSTARFQVAEKAQLTVFDTESSLVTEMANLSEGGIAIHASHPLADMIGKSVEVAFTINGAGLRFTGVVRWQHGQDLGIGFHPVASRRKEQLTEVLEEIELELKREAEARAKAEADAAAAKAKASAASAKGGERRLSRRHTLSNNVILQLVKSGIEMPGTILDVSQGGCKLATAERFPLGIYTRCEVEFIVDGLPFRLPGVVQSIHNTHTIGIRFIDLSVRKMEQLADLFDELDEKQSREAAPSIAS